MDNSTTFPLSTLDISDLLDGCASPREIADFANFRLMVELKSTIIAVKIIDIILDIIEDGVVYPLVSMYIIYKNHQYGVTVSMSSADLIKFVNFDKEFVNDFIS